MLQYVLCTYVTDKPLFYYCLGVEIGFERSTYSVNEDAGAVTVCAALQSVRNMESGRSFAMTFRTASGSEWFPISIPSHYAPQVHKRALISHP